MLMDIIKKRHSIRKYTSQQISREDLEKILEAGTMAPNASAGQRTMMVAIRNAELTRRIGIMNMLHVNRKIWEGYSVSKEQPSVVDDPTMKDGFYGAPAVVAVFAPGDSFFAQADSYCVVENMVLQATELGIASCIISRWEQTFASEEGMELMKNWEVPEDYTCQSFLILGYLDGEEPHQKPIKPGRVKIIE